MNEGSPGWDCEDNSRDLTSYFLFREYCRKKRERERERVSASSGIPGAQGPGHYHKRPRLRHQGGGCRSRFIGGCIGTMREGSGAEGGGFGAAGGRSRAKSGG